MGTKSSKEQTPVEPLNVDATKQFKVYVEFCNAWGYGNYVRTLQNELIKHYPNARVEAKPIPGGTGCLEVFVFPDPNGTEKHLVHSKLKGDGVIKAKNVRSIVEKISHVVEK